MHHGLAVIGNSLSASQLGQTIVPVCSKEPAGHHDERVISDTGTRQKQQAYLQRTGRIETGRLADPQNLLNHFQSSS